MRELQLLIKPVSSACDLACTYCFYKDEAGNRAVGDHGKDEPARPMRAVVDKALASSQTCVFGFQGGEPTLAGLSFFAGLYSLRGGEETAGSGRRRSPYRRTGTGWMRDGLRFLKEKDFLVGLSLDGVRKTHDENRKDYQGEGTFPRVFDSACRMQELEIPFQVLCVLNAQTAPRAGAIYRFFMRKGFTRQQYIPCLDPLEERRGGEVFSLTPELYGEALGTLFDLWFQDKLQGYPVYIRQFENYVEMLRGGQPEACSMYGRCSMQNVIESDGTVYPCDFYALDVYEMGNIADPDVDFESLARLARGDGPETAAFFKDPAARDDRCPGCRWYPLCRGGCRRDCFTAPAGEREKIITARPTAGSLAGLLSVWSIWPLVGLAVFDGRHAVLFPEGLGEVGLGGEAHCGGDG